MVPAIDGQSIRRVMPPETSSVCNRNAVKAFQCGANEQYHNQKRT